MKNKPVLISQPEFRALAGFEDKKFYRAYKAGFLPKRVSRVGTVPYYNRAEAMAFIRGEWTAETAEQWRKDHRAEMMGELPSEDREVA